MSVADHRAAIFQALAEGLDLPQVQERFQISRDQLQELFREASGHYRESAAGVWSLYCDGASRGNPGQAGAGALLLDPGGETKVQQGRYLGQTTNNVAEYQALLLGLNLALDRGIRKIQVFADSELLVRQLNGQYRVKAPHLLPLWQAARQTLGKFETYKISHVPRDLNQTADRLANEAIDQKAQVG